MPLPPSSEDLFVFVSSRWTLWNADRVDKGSSDENIVTCAAMEPVGERMRAFGCVATEGQIEMDGEVLQQKK